MKKSILNQLIVTFSFVIMFNMAFSQNNVSSNSENYLNNNVITISKTKRIPIGLYQYETKGISIGGYSYTIKDKDKDYYLHIIYSDKKSTLRIAFGYPRATMDISKVDFGMGMVTFAKIKLGESILTKGRGVENDWVIDINENTPDLLEILTANYDEKRNVSGKQVIVKRTFNPNIKLDLSLLKNRITYEKAKSGSIDDCISYLKTNPIQSYKNSIENILVKKSRTIYDVISVIQLSPNLRHLFDEKLFLLVEKRFNNEDFDKYLTNYPNGKYVLQVKKYKAELLVFEKCDKGTVTDCNNYISKYPYGKFISEVKDIKNKKIRIQEEKNRIAKRSKQIKINENKSLWKLGNKICLENSNGIICGAINQWNEDKSFVQIKIVTSPGGSLDGEDLTKNNLIWVSSKGKGWHLCLDDEIASSLKHDKSSHKEHNNTNIDANYCSKCGGRGVCLHCNGRGGKPCDYHDTNGDGNCTHCNNTNWVSCIYCNGKGTCSRCRGTGRK